MGNEMEFHLHGQPVQLRKGLQMSVQTFILNLFPAYLRLKKLHLARDQDAKEQAAEANRCRSECNALHMQLQASRTEFHQLRRELQVEKLRNELPRVFLTKDQILKLMAFSTIDPNIHRELEHAYEKLVQLQVRKERQSNLEA